MSRREIHKYRAKNPGVHSLASNYTVQGLDGQMLHQARTEGLTQLRAAYESQMAAFNGVATSPFYLFAQYQQGEITEEEALKSPLLRGDFVLIFYNKAEPGFRKRNKSLQILCQAGEALISQEQKVIAEIALPETKIAIAEGLLGESYTQVDFFNTLNDMPAATPRGLQYLSDRDRIETGRIISDIGTKKTENFRETMRRSIPRFMWHPLDYPRDLVPPEFDGMMRDLWIGYSPKEAHYLVHPDTLVKGKAPLHMVLEAAEEIEIEGAEDLGYTIRTNAITTLIDMESKRAALAVHPEVPLFTHIVTGAITGEVPEARGAFFDYAASIGETMSMTLERLQREIIQGVDGPASRFVQKLAGLYPDIFPELFARALVQGAKWSDEADELSLLKAVSQKEFSWARAAIEKTLELPERRLLTMDEVDALAANFSPQTDVITPDEAAEKAALLLGEEDSISIGNRVKQNGFAAEIGVDIDANSKSLQATIRVTNNGKSRYVPFHLGLPPVMDSFKLDLLSTGEFKETTIEALQSMVLRAINEAAIKRQNAMRKQPDRRPSVQVSQETRVQQSSAKLGTRNERMAAYAGSETAADEASGISAEVVFDLAKHAAAAEGSRSAVRVVGLSTRNIRALLDEANINMSPAAFRAKMKHAARLASSNDDGRFGKRLTLEAAGSAGKGFKLYEVKWTIHNEHLAIRGIFRDIGDGRYELVGILNKKGNDQQTKYLTQLVRSLRDSESDM